MIVLAKVTALLAVDYSSANHNRKEDEPLLSSGESLHILDHSNTTTVKKVRYRLHRYRKSDLKESEQV
jgi:hypothetical protein